VAASSTENSRRAFLYFIASIRPPLLPGGFVADALKLTWLEVLEPRTFLSAAFDLSRMTALRADRVQKYRRPGVSVVVIDTVDTTHPLIKPNYSPAWTSSAAEHANRHESARHARGRHRIETRSGARLRRRRGAGVGIIALNVFSAARVAKSPLTIAASRRRFSGSRIIKKIQHRRGNMSLGGGFYTDPKEVAATFMR